MHAQTALGRKDNLARLLGPVSFAPTTYVLPHDKSALALEVEKRDDGDQTFIVKPARGSMGKGIKLCGRDSLLHAVRDAGEVCVADRLITPQKRSPTFDSKGGGALDRTELKNV